jgi:hypothetical protein
MYDHTTKAPVSQSRTRGYLNHVPNAFLGGDMMGCGNAKSIHATSSNNRSNKRITEWEAREGGSAS